VVKSGLKITPIPGASSVVAAVSAAGFSDSDSVFGLFAEASGGPANVQEGIGLGRTVVVLSHRSVWGRRFFDQ